VNFHRPSNFCQIITITHFCPHALTTSKRSLPCNRICCKTCPFQIPTHSFTSYNTNLSYHITTLVDCKSSNLFLSQHINGHWSTSIIVNSDLPLPVYTKSHQLSFQERWSIHVTHKFPDATPTMSTANLKWHTNLYFNPHNQPLLLPLSLP
jgi:hypothetical protein